jgi:hypothetical protein
MSEDVTPYNARPLTSIAGRRRTRVPTLEEFDQLAGQLEGVHRRLSFVHQVLLGMVRTDDAGEAAARIGRESVMTKEMLERIAELVADELEAVDGVEQALTRLGDPETPDAEVQ